MEYRLNKIDTELRQILKDATKEGKVHGYKKLSKINGYREEEKNQKKNENFKKEFAKYSGKEKISVDAIKMRNVSIEASREAEDLTKGRFLDTKR